MRRVAGNTIEVPIVGVILLLLWSIVATAGALNQQRLYRKADVCNRAFRLYFYYNQGITIDLDKFHEDAVKWVDDPAYIPEHIDDPVDIKTWRCSNHDHWVSKEELHHYSVKYGCKEWYYSTR